MVCWWRILCHNRRPFISSNSNARYIFVFKRQFTFQVSNMQRNTLTAPCRNYTISLSVMLLWYTLWRIIDKAFWVKGFTLVWFKVNSCIVTNNIYTHKNVSCILSMFDIFTANMKAELWSQQILNLLLEGFECCFVFQMYAIFLFCDILQWSRLNLFCHLRTLYLFFYPMNNIFII